MISYTYISIYYAYLQYLLSFRTIWNHFLNDSERTTNNVEGFHSKLNKRRTQSMNFLKLLSLIKAIQDENEAIMKILFLGRKNPPKTLTKCEKINHNLAELKIELRNNVINIKEYIDNVCYFLHLN